MVAKKKIAVFDIDGTIFRSSLLIEVVEEMVNRGVLPGVVRKRYFKEREGWLNRKGKYEDYIMSVVRAFEENTKGLKFSDFQKCAQAVVLKNEHRVYRYTRDLVSELRRKKYCLIAISHSPKYIVHDFALRMGFDKIYGRILELDNKGRLTGNTHYEDLIMDKAKIFRRVVEKENFTLAGSVGVGDTESDAAFLSLVSKPICFNPNAGLYRLAKKKNWKVVVERKDVVYQINN